MKEMSAAIVVAGLVGGCAPGPFTPPEGADPPDVNGNAAALTTTRVASGLSRPVFVTAPPDDFDRIFILEQHTGRIRILNLPALEMNETPFMTIANLATGNEQGLLGMAFAPDYDSSGRFYVNYTPVTDTPSAVTQIARGTVLDDPDVANTSLEVILSITQPFSNHNGGWIGFGPNGYLYIATGDGGSANDPGDRAQNITSQRLGKLLRIDVGGRSGFTIPADNPFVGIHGDDVIWAYGLRNPWRCSFDRLTGDLYIADVGQASVEELDFQPAGSPGGENYGWPCMEGSLCLGSSAGCTCDADGLTAPIHEYTHSSGCSVTGGYVYRGSAMPDLRGTYFFADYCSGGIWSFDYLELTRVVLPGHPGRIGPRGRFPDR